MNDVEQYSNRNKIFYNISYIWIIFDINGINFFSFILQINHEDLLP